jgi:hypothetical protein
MGHLNAEAMLWGIESVKTSSDKESVGDTHPSQYHSTVDKVTGRGMASCSLGRSMAESAAAITEDLFNSKHFRGILLYSAVAFLMLGSKRGVRLYPSQFLPGRSSAQESLVIVFCRLDICFLTASSGWCSFPD